MNELTIELSKEESDYLFEVLMEYRRQKAALEQAQGLALVRKDAG